MNTKMNTKERYARLSLRTCACGKTIVLATSLDGWTIQIVHRDGTRCTEAHRAQEAHEAHEGRRR